VGKEIRTAFIGTGNCCSNLVQGLYFYKDAQGDNVPGLMHSAIGGYKISDVKPVAAFDVDSRKVGKDLSQAIFAGTNNTVEIAKVPNLGCEVMKGPVLDGIGEMMSRVISIDPKQKPVDVAAILEEKKIDVLVNFLPVGSAEATQYYAEAALKSGVAFANAIPEFIASDPAWAKRFADENVAIIGDDTKAMFGATIVHRTLTKLCQDRGATIDNTYQLNVGGNTDFFNMLEHSRLKSKKISKTESVQSQMLKRLPDENIHVGPSDYVPWLKSRKLCFLRIEGRLFGDVPFNIEARLDVEDKANSSGVIIDAIRCAALAKDRNIGGVLISPSAYFCKHPPQQFPDPVARQMLEEFISGQRER